MNSSIFPKPTEMAQHWLQQVIKPGDHVVDATLGNGHDALFLAKCVGDQGKVFGFDVQEEALQSATRQMNLHGISESVYQWHLMSHACMRERVTYPVKAVMFNLGYLPGADHSIITSTEQTMMALEAARELVAPGGIITVVCYPGHEGGEVEADAVRKWAMRMGAEWHVIHYEKWATKNAAPELIAMQKKEALS
ncbi:MAG: hypothetical protein RLZZ553_309 [Verrucomicrobiota bacterium]|jgi:tRNA A58 N-methylase Trm61